MTFQDRINKIVDHWNKYPLPEHVEARLMTSIEGINEQINNLPSGTGMIFVALTDESDPAKIRTETIIIDKS